MAVPATGTCTVGALPFQHFDGEHVTGFDVQQFGQVIGEDDAVFWQFDDVQIGIEQPHQAALGLDAMHRGAVETVFKL